MARIVPICIGTEEFGASVVEQVQETQDRTEVRGYPTGFVRLRISRTPKLDGLRYTRTVAFRGLRYRVLEWREFAEKVELDCEEDRR